VSSEPRGGRLAKITVEATVEITDDAAVIEAALADLDRGEFATEEERDAHIVEIKGDSVVAVGCLVDPFGLLPEVHGVEITHAEDQAVEVHRNGLDRSTYPDFGAIFPLCRCGKDSCATCEGYQLTPRTAVVLWTVAQLLADRAYDDVTQHGDEPLIDDSTWSLFDRYPQITWRQDAVWRRQAARGFDDLAADLAAGRWPLPTCPGEELALHLILEDAPSAVNDGWGLGDTTDALPGHPDDYDWGMASEVLFQDHDILDLFDAEMDGIEDPDSEYNKTMGIGCHLRIRRLGVRVPSGAQPDQGRDQQERWLRP
jgi:hypothetical protein